MKVITAPEPLEASHDRSAFLGGGCTGCAWWQDKVIDLLDDVENGVLYNPRRRDFPMDDPDAARGQITWEFYALDHADIFSMWFEASESVQPICMYELGRHILAHSFRSGNNWGQVVVGVAPGYKREQDVRIQLELAAPIVAKRITTSLEEHADQIFCALMGTL